MNQTKNKNIKTVLIVDDEKLFLASLKEGMAALTEEFSVLTANNGQMAIEMLRAHNIDLVVTDLKMPGMDGFELLARMMSDYPHIPTIVMTAFGTPEIEKQLQDLDAYDYLEKPVDLQMLADKIRSGINKYPDGHITGIMLFSFLQMLHVERKTCVLKITSQERKGTLYFSKGELVDALYGKKTGEEAAFEIVCWEEPEIELMNMSKKLPNHIQRPLQNILMEAARLKDEKAAAAEENEKNSEQEKLRVKSESTKPPDQFPTAFAHQRALLADEKRTPTLVTTAGNVKPKTVENQFLNLNNTNQKKENIIKMANNVNQSLEELMAVEGAMAVALVDSNSGMALGATGSGVNLEVAAAGNSEVVKSKQKVMGSLGLKDKIEDILISLGQQYHLIRPLVSHPNLFFYLVLNRTGSNLAMARFKLSDVESRVEV